MSFLIHGTVHTLNALEDMGYNTYKEIFGNYIDDDYKTTQRQHCRNNKKD